MKVTIDIDPGDLATMNELCEAINVLTLSGSDQDVALGMLRERYLEVCEQIVEEVQYAVVKMDEPAPTPPGMGPDSEGKGCFCGQEHPPGTVFEIKDSPISDADAEFDSFGWR